MSCIVHSKCYRSLFQSILNQLHNENVVPSSNLRTMSSQCCTCNDYFNETAECLKGSCQNEMVTLTKLREKINKETNINPKLISSFNRFQNLIEQYKISSPDILEIQMREPSGPPLDSDAIPMETSQTQSRVQKNINRKKQNPIKDGTFLFLPYQFHSNESRKNSDQYTELAKTLQRGRFIGRKGHIALIGKTHNAVINMLTPSTHKAVIEALEIAKSGLGNLTIHNVDNVEKTNSENENGEWVLVRPKNKSSDEKQIDTDSVIAELTCRWESCLKAEKRGSHEVDETENEDHHRKK